MNRSGQGPRARKKALHKRSDKYPVLCQNSAGLCYNVSPGAIWLFSLFLILRPEGCTETRLPTSSSLC